MSERSQVEPFNPSGEVHQAIASLGAVPDRFVYFDDYSNAQRELVTLADDEWKLFAGGEAVTFMFAEFPESLRPLIKHWVICEMTRTQISSAYSCMNGLQRVHSQLGPSALVRALEAHPMELRAFWHARVYPEFPQWAARGFKSLIHFCCERSLGRLSPEYVDFVAAFRLPARDEYAAVRSGEAFLTLHEEAALCDYLSELSEDLRRDPEARRLLGLRDACFLALTLQWALRPKSIALLRDHDVRISADDDGAVSATFEFEAVKRRSGSDVEVATRSCRPEWASIFAAYQARRDRPAEQFSNGNADHTLVPDSFFRASPNTISGAIVDLTAALLSRSRPAVDLRHTAAQRLADAGATMEELRRFLLHAEDSEVGLIYIDQSPTQASKLNQALALSPIYTAIVEIAKTRVIDKSKLPGLEPDHQIGGCPHGFPIAGIGACEIGQSLCRKNPVLSCYSCRKFLPVSDLHLHEQVRDSLREVVKAFFDSTSSVYSAQMPAYSQLSRTIAAVDATIEAVRSGTPT